MAGAAGDAPVRLRGYRDTDVDDLVLALADPVIRRFMPLLPSPYTRADAERWLTEGVAAAGGCAYAVADPRTDRLIGTVGLDRAVPMRGQFEIGYWTAPWARGRGVARAAVRLLSERAFADGAGRLELLTGWTNVASQRVALAAGFTREGVRRGGSARPGGGRDDLIVFARVTGDPPGPVERLLPDLPGGELSDGIVTLRPLAPDDAEFYRRLATLPDVVATSVPPELPDDAEVRLRCERSAAHWLAGERADMVILDAADGAPVGVVTLAYREPECGQAMIGYSVLPRWRGRGHATRSVELVVLWAFAETTVGRLVAGTHPDNVASQRVLAKAGFHREAHVRSRWPGPAGRRSDAVEFALLPGDLMAGDLTAGDLTGGDLTAGDLMGGGGPHSASGDRRPGDR